LQVLTCITTKVSQASEYLRSEDRTADFVGVGSAGVLESGVAREHLADVLCDLVGYPYDLVIPGMLLANMLEFNVHMASGTIRLKLLSNWRRAIQMLDGMRGAVLGSYV
jgi:hypothetical protein